MSDITKCRPKLSQSASPSAAPFAGVLVPESPSVSPSGMKLSERAFKQNPRPWRYRHAGSNGILSWGFILNANGNTIEEWADSPEIEKETAEFIVNLVNAYVEGE